MKKNILVLFSLCLASGPAYSDGLSPLETLGKSIFFDANLSINGMQSCASCHDPAMGFTSPNSEFNATGAVVEGALAGKFGNRKPPSIAYASESPVLHHIFDEGDVTFVGGAFLDGRATGRVLGNPTADQAEGPFLNPLEMAMPHKACVVQRVLEAKSAGQYPITLHDVWGAGVPQIDFPADLAAQCATPGATIEIADEATSAAIDAAFGEIAYAISAYEASSEVNRFNSRYDHWVAGEGGLNDEERAGLEMFTREDKGNCAACHVLSPSTSGKLAVLTDWTFDNLGVPKNRDNPFYKQAEANPDGMGYIDPGLGGFLKTDLIYAAYANENMGRQQVPTLRNLMKGATNGAPKSFMHNGYFKTLEGVVHFYNTRDILPPCEDEWASEAEALEKGCWPIAEIPATVNHDELGNLKLTDTEEHQIVAFMNTLNDE
ncbi:cytochrome-c peroxidase [Thioclava sp.]|uniref:cytochrome-c peroxidase n=1 Tax=Thioclava sp. TaxID=1933450 RepID=UPI003AA9A8B1